VVSSNPEENFMKIKRQIIVFDAADLAAESAFWAGLLGGTVVAEDDWHSVLVDGEWRLGVQLAPNHVPSEWPDGTQQQQIHLDLHVDDLQAAHEEAISLGARLLESSRRPRGVRGLPGLCRSRWPPVLPGPALTPTWFSSSHAPTLMPRGPKVRNTL